MRINEQLSNMLRSQVSHSMGERRICKVWIFYLDNFFITH